MTEEEIAKLKDEGSKICNDYLKRIENDIINLKIQVEEGKKIKYCMETKLSNKTIECTNLEEEIITLKRDLKDEKEQVEKILKLKEVVKYLMRCLVVRNHTRTQVAFDLKKENVLSTIKDKKRFKINSRRLFRK